MKKSKFFYRYLFLTFLLLPFHASLATTVKPFNLSQMTGNADKIFRAEVIAVKTGAINVGGGELSTTTYTFRVNDLIKGQLSKQSGKINNIIELQMVGSLKKPNSENGIRNVGGFRTPKLITGNEYLLFTTPPSSVGLSMTVGVGQGLFSFKDGSFVRNEFNNVGLFRGMASSVDFPSQGPVDYNTLVQQIESLISE